MASKPAFDYEADAARRAAIHAQDWAGEDLNWWQKVILSGEENNHDNRREQKCAQG